MSMKIGVVDVGGGLRGIYAVGVLDYCMDQGMDYVYGTLCRSGGENPLDYPALRNNPMEFYVVATNALTGEPKYFDKGDIWQDDYSVMKASSAIPFVCKPYEVQGLPYFSAILKRTKN